MNTSDRRLRISATISAAALLIVIAASACGTGNSGENDTTTAAADSVPTTEELANATYAGVLDKPVTLTDGRWEGAPFVDGGASRPSVGLVKNFALTGDINGDGRDDAVVLLWESSGGSGTRNFLAAMSRANGAVVNLGTELIGDRVQVKEGFISDGSITLDLIETGPGDAACCPSQKALIGWKLTDGRLERVDSEITGTLSLADLQGTEWVLAEIGPGGPVAENPPVTIVFAGDRVAGNGGCNGYFGTVSSQAPGRLAFSAMGATMKICPEPGNDLERRYLRALAGGSTYGFIAGRLVIGCETDDGLVQLLFRRREAAAPLTDQGS
jgi:heat shock protein HslJ